jgi:nitrogen fixation protein NifB
METSLEKQSKVNLRVAVTSYEGVLINQHLGMASSILIFDADGAGGRLVDRRQAPRGSGDQRWEDLSAVLSDCSALLTSSIGQRPDEVLSSRGLKIYEVEGLIEDALIAISEGKELRMPRRNGKGCRCSGGGAAGTGC